MPVFSSIVAILFFLNCQKQDYRNFGKKSQTFSAFLQPLCLHLSISISTSTVSGPMRQIHFHGMISSNSMPNSTKHFPGPGTISASIYPHFGSNSRSITHPSDLPSATLMTSLSSSSHKRIRYPLPQSLFKLYAAAVGTVLLPRYAGYVAGTILLPRHNLNA